jgi:hypothetical protein
MRRLLIALAAIASALPSVVATAQPSDTATSPDGRYRVWVKVERPPAAEGVDRGITSLWLTDTRTHISRMVVRGNEAPSNVAIFSAFGDPHFLMDGTSVYLSVVAGEVSMATFRVDLRTGARRFAMFGGAVGVMRTGPYAGCLLVQQHRYWTKGGSYNPVVLVRPNGKQLLMIPGSENDDGERSVGYWLHRKGWRAS